MADYLSTAPYKGTRDFYPDEMRIRTWMFQNISEVLESFGFEKIDAPLIEPVEMYLAKTSEEIVNQQIYSFTDRGGRNVAIRPEITPTVARMVAQKIRELPRPIRWYSIPNLWRYEKMGKGRLREHWQVNADLLGTSDEIMADVEILQLANEVLAKFGASKEHYQVYINHRKILNLVFEKILKIPVEKWAAISRVMDKKEKISAEEFTQMLISEGLAQAQAEELKKYMSSGMDYLKSNGIENEECVFRFLEVFKILDSLGYGELVQYNPAVIRGFDYYTGLVFEIFDKHPDNRRSLFGGGRYDNLVSAFSKDAINAVGFGMGDVTFVDFLKAHNLLPEIKRNTEIYIAVFASDDNDSNVRLNNFKLSANLRKAGFRVELSSGHKKLGKQFDEAHSKNIPFVVLQGAEETKKNSVMIKDMSTGAQEEVPYDQLTSIMRLKLS
ncbi:MAG: histidine--tRNA ligase [Spirochaetia bacterium]|nr:histidine--tRNA ligase [Spirochaetia bacterium]